MDINSILDYQKKDAEIIRLQMQLANSPDRKMLVSITALVKESQNTSAQLEKKSETALKNFSSLKDAYEELMTSYQLISKQSEEVDDQEESKKILNKANEISKALSSMEKKLLTLAEKINSILSEYDIAKKKYNLAGQKHKVHKANYDQLTSQINPQIQTLEGELKTLAKSVDAGLMEKYTKKKQDKIFPVFVPDMNNTCGGCMMQLPSAQVEKLAKDGFLECENCRRIIYKKQS